MNIVFDLGGVVFNWRPGTIIETVFRDPARQALVRTGIFEHADWVALDRGTLALRDAIERGAARTGLPRHDIARLLDAVPSSLTPKHDTIELIRAIRATRTKLFVLSNMHLASIAYLEKEHDIWGLFDGIVISSRIHKVKPEVAIYKHLLSVHQLEASETVFIDDMRENLDAASTLGIKTIQFVDADQCRKALLDHRGL